MKSLGFVFSSAPHGTCSGREGLDAVLATSAYSEDLNLFFIADGVFQLLNNQQPDQVLCRDYIATFKMLELYDIENIYVCRQSLAERGIGGCDLLIDVELLEPEEITAKLQQCQRILSY